MRKAIFSVLVHNEYGVVTRISGLFTRRGFNITSFTGEETDNPKISRITIVAEGDERELAQIKSQVEKLVDVIKVVELDVNTSVQRELALIKVKTDDTNRTEVFQIVETFRGKIIDIDPESIIVELTGDLSKVKAFLELMKRYGIIEIVRTGGIALQRGKGSIHDVPVADETPAVKEETL
ncbi:MULTISPECIES: acetolactate synthase small subunit [Tepidanaerobacter]|uniref:Acetolactate synthase small subunit n=1 Tax=Tepidanaerobacter syntrophicus TaxID=224999 RepID=A0A0U9HEQ9_9FIRM|nr:MULTISPECIES: acetolactate synthase small subunit [Tepidanaerobacter]GAQ24982.1 acetolactate synthase-1/3 small subunit [Tepidanaerobacter syntrophicus]GLI19726.1 acetolactate synthase small subunit [Tepidanaerobacter syntrophicus]GLI51429.1 acetolactate synthase small subunit [Tepidanaerobacter syntrophicus]HHV84116.1 acetolactate synthase small subunit [Tepidanaerobacter syntrophicus]